MAHEIEQLSGGRAAFVSAREPAWHRLGEVTENCMTATEIMAKAFLGGWHVRKVPLVAEETTADGTLHRIEVPDRWATVRMFSPGSSGPTPPGNVGPGSGGLG